MSMDESVRRMSIHEGSHYNEDERNANAYHHSRSNSVQPQDHYHDQLPRNAYTRSNVSRSLIYIGKMR